MNQRCNAPQIPFSMYSLVIVLLGFWLIFHPNIAFSAKPEATKQELSAIQEKLKQLKEKLLHAQAAQKDAADALKKSEVAISDSKRKLFEITKEQNATQKKLATLKQKTVEINADLDTQNQLLSQQFYNLYTQAPQNYLQLIFMQENPNALARDMHYLSYVSQARARLIEEMQANLATLKDLNDRTQNALKTAQSLRQSTLSEQKKLESEKHEKSSVIASLSTEIEAQRNTIDKLKRDEESLASLVKQLAKAAKDKEQKRLAKQKDKKIEKTNDDQQIANNEIDPSQEFTESNFAKLKGKLRLPVKGSVMNRFGQSRKDTGLSWKGLFIEAPEGTVVKSVAKGKIVFAQWMRGFGNLIIIDHNGGYMSLYGFNQALLKPTGTVVNVGDAIAEVGNTGGNAKNGLYYELRKNSHPFDPLKWSRLK